jgi:poly(3-hydroxyalkanoate) synthetase
MMREDDLICSYVIGNYLLGRAPAAFNTLRRFDLRQIRTPCYFLSTIDDHVSAATYPATQVLSGTVQLVVGGSGHIAGVIDPPSKKKYGYWTGDRLTGGPDEWLEHAERDEGSGGRIAQPG